MGDTDQPRDTWGRWSARPGGRSTPERPTAAALFTEGNRAVYLTNERTPHYQVWDGATLVVEKPASRAWKRDQDDAVALAKGMPRDTSNLVALTVPSQNLVINDILRGARGLATATAASGIKLRSKGEIALANLLAENLQRENSAGDPDVIRQRADYLAGSFAQAGSGAVAAERVRQAITKNENEGRDEDTARESERYE